MKRLAAGLIACVIHWKIARYKFMTSTAFRIIVLAFVLYNATKVVILWYGGGRVLEWIGF